VGSNRGELNTGEAAGGVQVQGGDDGGGGERVNGASRNFSFLMSISLGNTF
jgi:hypothetical protein